MQTAIVFGNDASLGSMMLTDSLLRAAARKDGFRVLALVDASEIGARSGFAGPIKWFLYPYFGKLIDPTERMFIAPERAWTLARLGRRYGVPVIVPDRRDINDPEFVETLSRDWRSDFAFSLGCPQVFKPDLLSLFKDAINHHNGRLPDYRGWAATEWSIYNGEETSGFTFHRMNAVVDDGPILLEGSMPIGDLPLEEVRHRKTRLGADGMETLLDRVVAGDPGKAQVGAPRYFSRKDMSEIVAIEAPDTIVWDELQRRIRAFGAVRMRLGDRDFRVSRVARIVSTPARLAENMFVTSDGVTAAVSRVGVRPWRLARLTG